MGLPALSDGASPDPDSFVHGRGFTTIARCSEALFKRHAESIAALKAAASLGVGLSIRLAHELRAPPHKPNALHNPGVALSILLRTGDLPR